MIIALVAGLMLNGPAATTYAAGTTFNVNNTLDTPDATPGDGTCATATGNGICTLRAAIQEANALAGTDVIHLQSGTTYVLTRAGQDDTALNGDLDITSSLNINGAGAGSTIVDGGGLDRVFDIHAGVVTISGVTIQNGAAHEGGGIENNATLNLNSSAVKSNTAYSYGGGIDNHGPLTLYASTVSGNTDIGPTANGGGI
ncbi:MAG: CSLREA domain-containing protein, partial [Roseiflexaceae bacterium]